MSYRVVTYEVITLSDTPETPSWRRLSELQDSGQCGVSSLEGLDISKDYWYNSIDRVVLTVDQDQHIRGRHFRLDYQDHFEAAVLLQPGIINCEKRYFSSNTCKRIAAYLNTLPKACCHIIPGYESQLIHVINVFNVCAGLKNTLLVRWPAVE